MPREKKNTSKLDLPTKRDQKVRDTFWSYSGDKYPQWRNNLFIATLSGGHVRRLEISENRVTQQEELLGELGLRWRCPRTGPDGYLYLSTDDGRIGRLTVDE